MRNHFTLIWMLAIKNVGNNECWLGYRSIVIPIHCWGDIKSYSHYGKLFDGSSKFEQNYHVILQLHSSIHPKNWTHTLWTQVHNCTKYRVELIHNQTLHMWIFIEALFTITTSWVQPTFPTMDEWKTKCDIYITTE